MVETRVKVVPLVCFCFLGWGGGGVAGRKSPTEGKKLNQTDVCGMKQDRVGHGGLELSVLVCKPCSAYTVFGDAPLGVNWKTEKQMHS